MKRKPFDYYARHMAVLIKSIDMMPPAAVQEIANGCGPKGGFLGLDLVPDDFLGLDVGPACVFHDVGYELGENDEDKFIADLMFLFIMAILNHFDQGESTPIKALRYNFVMKYFVGVSLGGDDAFYTNKEIPA
jgi:hypothetical protein